ncbi:MAG: nicotinate (nicotinamide) nucleotide adenylyltransferase [Clostridiales bacterium]|nr:nicotinate (nicotinamide) nucleotide adenylyltransferase [Clostridiales bacterium]
MKIGLFGGSFNPPHIGHTLIAKDFYYASNVDLLIIMPAYISPFKGKTDVGAETRLEMAKLAFLPLGEEGICYKVSDYEISKGDVSYTVDTVEHLLREYNVEKIHLCVGSDMLFSIENWKNAKTLMEKCVIYSKERKDGEYESMCAHAERLREKYGAQVIIMHKKPYEASSTEARTDINSLENTVSGKVREYIKEKRLFEYSENGGEGKQDD